MEHLVLETVEEIFSSENARDACHCERCRLDIAAIVLNSLPPAYVVTFEGEVKKRSYALVIQYKADIVREITKAMQTVATRVHHDRDNG
jgi:competence protein ComFB